MGTDSTIRRRLLAWYEKNRRDLPWRKTNLPYRIWVSEIMLQQTRVAAVIPHYQRFVERFPDVAALAAAPEGELLAAWSGLGYYTRARNLQRAARIIAEQGRFPRQYEGIRALPGVGDYTAAAIASIAFGLPWVAIDGNVLRVVSRLSNDAGDIGSVKVRSRLREFAEGLLDRRRPGDFNQALMELGATVCLPKTPRCSACPLSRHCEALAAGTQEELPVKLRANRVQRVEKTVLLIERDGEVLLRQRPDSAAKLAGFWELPEAGEAPAATLTGELGSFRHSITNHLYRFQVFAATVGKAPKGFRWIPRTRLAELPLSTVARKAMALVK